MWALQITVTEWAAAGGFVAASAFALAFYIGRSSRRSKGLGL
jgi:hypothetical protein